MGEKIVVGPINKGLRTDRTAFVIDNDSFPTLINAYQWRGRVKRKRGTSPLGRLQRYFSSTNVSYSSTPTIALAAITGAGNLLTGFSLQVNGNIVPGKVTITVGANIYTDPLMNGTLSPSGTINYSTGDIAIPVEAGNAASAIFWYYPDLPVMGLEDFVTQATQFPGTIAFDTTYSYNIDGSFPYAIYDVSFYKNPAPSALLPGYIQKTNPTPTTWNGQNYQQFWTVNYQNALWATNGINVPFSVTNIGMQFKPIQNIIITAVGPPAIATVQINAHGLSVGDFLYFNEVNGITGINFETGYVIAVIDANNVSVEFPIAVLGGAYTSGGIAQYLTNRSDITKDCLRFYDGDPTDGSVITPGLTGTKGWLNFAPPLSRSNFAIADLPAAQYYLVGARIIQPFKDRLLFIGPVVQTSGANSQIYLQDTVIYSQNGTAYYTSSFVGDASLATTQFRPILVPDNQSATAPAYFEDQTGFGGFITAGNDQPIITCSTNEDVLILGFSNQQTKLVYSGNDVIPFNFFLINSEYGSGSTFSAINMDQGVITRGNRGYVITGQTQTQRVDLSIPDQVFQINLTNNGPERVTSQRDFVNEWVYFTYPVNQVSYNFPNQTLQYNYRDDSWAIFDECYTTYGLFRRKTGYTWSNIGITFSTWQKWAEPWNAGSTTLLQPMVIAGNQQGFVIFRDDGTDEVNSLTIRAFTGNIVTCIDHCLNQNDYIIISGCLGSVSSQVNDKIFSVETVVDKDNFTLNPTINAGTYLGRGLIKRMYVPFVQTKQFPVAWDMSRKTRLGPQQYLLTTTQNSQITLLIFLSQNASSAYNEGPIIPEPGSVNDSLIYSTVLYTCPESTNLGLTPSNINLQMVTAVQQSQIWHRKNTSLIGDTVQIGFSLSDSQMRSEISTAEPVTITGITQAYPCVITAANSFTAGNLVRITGVVGMIQLNFDASANNNYSIISANATSITIDVDSSAFSAYVSGGSAVVVSPVYQFDEIELHAFVLDVQPSQVLA